MFDFDAETQGFYQSIGIERVRRALPYQAWVKDIERTFGTVCSNFSKRFDSYTGTLTGSKTAAKRQKNIDQMLERGELLTMEEFFAEWTKWKEKHYQGKKHRGLAPTRARSGSHRARCSPTAHASRRQRRPASTRQCC